MKFLPFHIETHKYGWTYGWGFTKYNYTRPGCPRWEIIIELGHRSIEITSS